ncbi:MAG: phosphoribosylaminoimidazolesuccinocarboxamide synthase [Planctomycetes bacterium]|nr:phosphoribosylaminoimidazolesuccinocarboxamide synthase [Planctomycetota bacterium]
MPAPTRAPLREASIPGLTLKHRGKVRDLFEVGDALLLVASDRVSAFDVILEDLLPDKGEVLTRISEFWFRRLEGQFRHHLITLDVAKMPPPLPSHPELAGRSMLGKRVKPLLAELVVRGYLVGSGWADYQKTGAVCGIKLPAGLKEASKLPQPLFTPSTKAPMGQHDENIDYGQLCRIIGADQAKAARDLVMTIYVDAAKYAESRGILLADTKIELGEDKDGILVIDELLTPDSSRFWAKETWEPGRSPPSYDKQIIRDALLAMGFNKKPPAPRLPAEVLQKATHAYHQIFERLTGTPFKRLAG